VQSKPTLQGMASYEIQRLIEAVEALANPVCCRGAGTSTFEVMGRDGRPTGEQVQVCNSCRREIVRP